MNNTKTDFQEYLNELGTPDHDLKSLGGRIPDRSKYGDWLRRYDPIAFEVGFQDWKREREYHNNKRERA